MLTGLLSGNGNGHTKLYMAAWNNKLAETQEKLDSAKNLNILSEVVMLITMIKHLYILHHGMDVIKWWKSFKHCSHSQ